MKQIHSWFELLIFVVCFKNCDKNIFSVLWRLVGLNVASGVRKDHAVFIFIYPASLLHWIWGRQFSAHAGKSATKLYCIITKNVPIVIFRVKKNLHLTMSGKASQISLELFCGAHSIFSTKFRIYFTHKFTRCSSMSDWLFFRLRRYTSCSCVGRYYVSKTLNGWFR